MMLRCPRQHRIGETCGAKLVHHESVTKSATICKICEEINTKRRRLAKTEANIKRWSLEPDKLAASLERAQREAKELSEKIQELHSRRPSIATRPGVGVLNGPSSPAAATTTLPPVTAISTSTMPDYEYTSAPGATRRQESGTYTVPRNGTMPAVNSGNAVVVNPAQTTNQRSSVPTDKYRQNATYTMSYARR